MFILHWLLLVYIFTTKHTNCLLCYSCNDLSSNQNCFNVTKCPPGEVCYGRADGFPTGDVKHTTGCTKELAAVIASIQGVMTFCSASCNGQLCNLDKCSIGTTNTSSRIRCLSCDYAKSVDDCTNVVQCSEGEMCYVSRFLAFGQVRYRLGCMANQHCGQKINVGSIIGKRFGPSDCSFCCSSNHCNVKACDQNGTVTVFHLNSMSPDVQCKDTDPTLCLTMGRLNKEACKEPSVVRTCSQSCDSCDHIGWGSWQSWGKCIVKDCDNKGIKSRSRQCLSRLNITKHQSCVGSSIDSISCYKYCPVNGGWCYRYEMYDCSLTDPACIYSCYSGYPKCVRKVTTTCHCPEPKYGGRTC